MERGPLNHWTTTALLVYMAVPLLFGTFQRALTDSTAAGPIPPAPTTSGPGLAVWHEACGLRYLELVPETDDPGQPVPLVVVLHGRGARPRILDVPWTELPQPVRIVAPVAPHPLGRGSTWLSARYGDGRTEELTREIADVADGLAVFLDEIRRLHPTVGRPIVSGFSQGGMLAWALAVRHPLHVSAAHPLAAWLPPGIIPRESTVPDAGPPILVIHGTLDSTIPVEPTRRAVTDLQLLGLDVTLVEIPGSTHARDPEMNDLLRKGLEDSIARETCYGPVTVW